MRDTPQPAGRSGRRDDLARSYRSLQRIERCAIGALLLTLLVIGTALPYL